MTQPVIQTAFHAGELSPKLYARVDMAKYRSAAAQVRNFYVDYRGGLSNRAGTKQIIRGYKDSTAIRLIPFQASSTVGYMLEFGENYIRFIYNGAPVLESTKAITGATKANPCVLSVASSGYTVGDWVYITGIAGMTQLNGQYCIVSAVDASTVTLSDMFGNSLDSSSYDTYTSGGTVARIYTITSPYAAADLAALKFVQDVDKMYITHQSYVPYMLTLVSVNNWALVTIPFGTSVSAPSPVTVSTTLGAGSAHYAYCVTSVDARGQESTKSSTALLDNKTDLRSVAGTNTITWTAVSGAVSYNVYKTQIGLGAAVPSGTSFGFIGNTSGTSLQDSNLSPDYTIAPPIGKNPFFGAGVISVAVTTSGTYSTTPTVTFSAGPVGGYTATGLAVLGVTAWTSVRSQSGSAAVGDVYDFSYGAIGIVATTSGSNVATLQPLSYSGSSPGTFVAGGDQGVTVPSYITGTNRRTGASLTMNVTWGVVGVTITYPGVYSTAPTIAFSSGTAAATATIDDTDGVNPAVPGIFSQRLFLGGPRRNPQEFNFSQTGNYFNFNVSDPVQANNAISGSIVSGRLNTIQSVISMPTGLIVFSDRQAWLLNGGSNGAAISPINVTANSQAYNGASGLQPIVSNYDILYVQAKGSIVRDLSYNFYANIFTGTDITVLSSHFFYGYTIDSWAYCEEPFKLIWCVRSDGALLCLTFMKEQELIGWTLCTTQGSFLDVASITETTDSGRVDALYCVVEREVNGTTVKFIERMAERAFESDASDAWFVDCGIQYSGTPATTFSGAQHLAGQTVTGLADGVVIPEFTMPADGSFTLATAASTVTVGLGYTARIQTLPLDIGEPTVQGKRKKINAVTLKVEDTLGLQLGRTWDTLVPVDDLVIGNLGSVTNEIVSGLVTGDARMLVDSLWDTPGQYCIEQSNPLPASVLGVIPEIAVGDTQK